MTEKAVEEIVDEAEVIAIRKEKLVVLREKGAVFTNNFKRDSLAKNLFDEHDKFSKEELAETKVLVKVAGRVVLKRVMGKASFIHILDRSGKI